MCRSSARTGPPRCTTAIQSPSGSTVLVAQSVKSGKPWPFGSGSSKPTTACGDPLPSMPWHVAQAATKICSPVAFGGSASSSEDGVCAARAGDGRALNTLANAAIASSSGGRETTTERYSTHECSAKPESESQIQSQIVTAVGERSGCTAAATSNPPGTSSSHPRPTPPEE